MRAVRILAVVCLVAMSAAGALAQGTYTQIDYPGAVYTVFTGINSTGEIVGYAAPQLGQILNGFLLSGGIFTTITYNGQPTLLYGLNDAGQIVGSYGRSGFIYDRQFQTFTKVQYEIWHTQPTGINNAGAVSGTYSKNNHSYSFELVGSTYSMIAPPGAITAFAKGISDAGKVVGYAIKNHTGTYITFTYDQQEYQRLILPNIPDALVYGTNPAGTALVGDYSPSSGIVAGFAYQNGIVETVQFPGANITNATAINSSGQVVGYFVGSDSNVHGFLWTPPAASQEGN